MSWLELAMFIGLDTFLVVNAFLGVKQKRVTEALPFLAATFSMLAFRGAVGLAFLYVAVFYIILRRSLHCDAVNVAPAYILFGHEESRYQRSGFRSRM